LPKLTGTSAAPAWSFGSASIRPTGTKSDGARPADKLAVKNPAKRRCNRAKS
jgi:hypothetical protein